MGACIPQMIDLQAEIAPDALALVEGTTVLSYRQLTQRANQLAHHLQSLGIGPGILTGLCVNRSIDLVVGLLGILKAGGTYLALDPSYPAERLAFMLADAQASLLITHNSLTSQFSELNVQLVLLDTHAELLTGQPDSSPAFTATEDDLVYVIYTSGSTGRPKGVPITHGSLLNLMSWHQRAFSVTSNDRATQIASPAFDATGWELWPYLTCGACIYLVDDALRLQPERLRDWLIERGITITFLPTALAESVMSLEWPPQVALRFLLTGADTLRHYPSPGLPFALINNYGPTEATVVATSGRVFPAENAEKPPTIGRPIDNTEIYLLDEHLQPVAPGAPGELYIGGAGVAKGYLNRPDLTAASFIPHPWNSTPGARLYRTGDLASMQPDGQIAFLGRADYQIKIRGFRIEPQEIISALEEHPAISTSIVIAREDTPGEKRLVAYVVLAAGAHVSSDELQQMLGERLPDYMIPSAFVRLDTLPVTPNGKLERKALLAPDATNTLRNEVTDLPASPVEERLAGVVASLLSLEQVGVDENFFMLGGHSLLGTQIIARVAETFGVTITLRSLFSLPTIRLLAAEIERLILLTLEKLNEDEVQLLLETKL